MRAELDITDGLPAGALVLLVGPSGSGKSTWAGSHFEPDQVLSSDHFRAMVAGDAADQAATADAFKVLHLIARARLRRRLLTVVDATNLTQGARRSLLRLGRAGASPVVAVVFGVSLRRCLEQNAARAERRVPDAVVRRHYQQLQTVLPLLHREGYDAIEVLQDFDIGAG